MTLTNLFTTANNNTATAGSGTLPGTAQLTNIASSAARNTLDIANNDLDKYGDLIVKSQTDTASLDKLIDECGPASDDFPLDFLKELDEELLESMLKSQQSKRSRCKSKEMTMDNYTSMLTAAIAENFIREALGREKGSFGGRASGPVQYSDERLAELADDQDALRKEIRNCQSKKSIMKSKAGFSEEDERWTALLTAEEQLKAIRLDSAPRAKDTLRDDLKELLAETDENGMKAADLKELVATIKAFVWSDVTTEEVDA